MKVRISENFLNVRLQENEIIALGNGEVLEVKLFFPGASFLFFRLLLEKQDVKLKASFKNGIVEISMSETEWKAWQQAGEIGVEYVQEGGEKEIRILAEKDLKKRRKQ
ncbi:hypothetical protein R9C00_20010 [Flammeovirgaceae bacterium SG7u.111]|nr:hypothetical protein [Flammeovirgaceae bacterium SG7u.132]WPO33986.1 hypothetical protein R9C00_20010 [Flammeovirgaceae bacterium SG7u.111]